jgi:Tfp pilus assembly protein PilV
MIRTIISRFKHRTRRSVARAPRRTRVDAFSSGIRWVPPLASEKGDTLIEVLISAVLIVLVVLAVLFGLDSTNRATALGRARAQADALAQQDEEKLRGEPIKNLAELERKETVTLGATTYTILTTAKYIADSTSTASCTSSAAKADYVKTISEVTWPSMGSAGAVIETGVISPPADSALIVQVQESGTPLAGAKVVAKGPAPATSAYELETSSNGCAILAVAPGEYSINVSKPGYVDPNGYPNTEEDLSVTRTVYLPAETTSKEGYNLGPAGKLKVGFTEPAISEGDSFVAYNTGMTAYRQFPSPATIGTYTPTVTSSTTIFPFTTKYTVYAGTCEANLPTKNGQSSNPEVSVPAGQTVETTVPLAPIIVKVLESNKGFPEKPLQNTTVRLEDTGCGAVREPKTTSAGALPHPGMPFGTYSLCVAATIGGKPRKYTTSIANNNASGVPVTIYLGEGEEKTGCP